MSIQVLVEGLDSVTFSFSQLWTWDRCNFKWGLSYREGWTPSVKKKALERGSVWHECMAMHYKVQLEGGDPRPVVTAYLEGLLQSEGLDGQLIQIVDQVLWLYELYYDWAQYADRGQITLAIEKHFAIPMHTVKGRWFILQGYIDHVFEESSKIWLRDHKSYSRSPISPIEAMMDPQMPVYGMALRQLGFMPFGIEFNQVNTYEYKKRNEVTPDKLFVRHRDFRSEQELIAMTEEIGRTVDEIFDAQNQPVLRRSLMRDCKMCDMQEPCLLALKGIPIGDAMQMGEGFRKKSSFVEVTTTDNSELENWSI